MDHQTTIWVVVIALILGVILAWQVVSKTSNGNQSNGSSSLQSAPSGFNGPIGAPFVVGPTEAPPQ